MITGLSQFENKISVKAAFWNWLQRM